MLLACAGCTRSGAGAPPSPGGSDASRPGVNGPVAANAEGPTREALERAAAWMAHFPEGQLRFDAAIGLTQLRHRFSSPGLDEALARARRVAEADADNPLRRLFQPDFTAPVEATSRWAVPKPGQPRVNVNRVLAEAVHCRLNGLREPMLDYLSGAMRDGGGYQTTHAVWALTLARDEGCLPADDFDRRAAPLLAELRQAQPARPGPSAQEVDLYGERVLMLELAHARSPDVARGLDALRAAQAPDGAFGAPEPGYLRYHATFVASWALALSLSELP